MSAPAPRPASSPKPVLDSLMQAPTAAHILQRAQWLDTLDQHLRGHLPPGLASHARLANVKGGRLVYLVDSANWHTRLRLASNQILDAARALGLEVNTLGIRIATRPWQSTAQRLLLLDAEQRRRFGTSSTEGRTLRELLAVLEETVSDDTRTAGVPERR